MKGSRIETEDKLHQQFKALEQEWDSYKQSNPRILRRYSTDTKAMADALELLDSSPTNLVSSLQHRFSPSGGWKMRTNDLAVEEIRRERRAVIESGRLKGRRLFEAPEVEAEMSLGDREKICNGCNCLTQENEVRSVLFDNSEDDHEIGSGGSKELPVCFQLSPSSSSSSSSLPSPSVEKEEGEVLEEEKKVITSVETRGVARGGKAKGRNWMVAIAWLVVASIVYAVCIIPIKSFIGHGDAREILLVPT